MTEIIELQKNNPLHGIKLKDLVTELVDFYGFEILSEQININCFKVNPSINSSLKFLRKTGWARDKVEAFYLYKYKQLPKPSDEQHELTPRERLISDDQIPGIPAEISLGDKEFFDDPESGAKPYINKRRDDQTQKKTVKKSKPMIDKSTLNAKDGFETEIQSASKPDPWANWRNKESKENNE